MTIPIHPVVFILAIFCLLIAIFAIGYAIGHNEGELKSSQTILTILILAQKEFTESEQEINNEIIHLPPPPTRRISHADLVQMEAEAKARMKDANNDKKAD